MMYFLSAQITQQSHAIVRNVFYLSKIATDIDAFFWFLSGVGGSLTTNYFVRYADQWLMSTWFRVRERQPRVYTQRNKSLSELTLAGC